MYSGDGSSLDPMFSGTSLQSLLSLNPSLFADGFPTLASLTDDPTLIPQTAEPPKILVPKTEPSQPFKFFPQYHPTPFLRLPQLRSPEQPQPKRQRLESPVIPQSNLARQRRQKLSEKTRCLQKLMPWDKKMDQGTLLEEAYKYVRFLQAQFRVLQSMPSHSSSSSPSFRQNSAVFVDLEKLNRSQLLQAKRLKWVDEGYELLVFTDECIVSGGEMSTRLQKELRDADILVIIAVTKQESVEWINNNSKTIENVICLDSSSDLKNRLGGYDVPSGVRGNIFGTSQSDKAKESYEVVQTVSEAWDRHNSDDIRFCLLVIINAYIRPVPVLNNLRAKGFSTLNCMLRNCGRQVLNCLLDPNCRKALQCMNQCSPVDQVCNYRCIASNESANLESFSQCVLQKNNCLGLEAEIPEKPCVPPMVKFRGQNLSYEMAEDLFVGWLGSLQWSWRVVAGQNPAYDQFPCQYQLFYRGKEKGSFWCEPVFQVKTLEGQMVWRRRKYRVRRGKVPGTFYFSVLDNGVASNEFWTIVDVAENLSWGLFHYHGAARVAGQSYTGAVLVSPDGAFPTDNRERTNIVAALDKCEIKEWELYNVDNCSCIDPPLGIPEGSSLHTVVQIEDPKQLSV